MLKERVPYHVALMILNTPAGTSPDTEFAHQDSCSFMAGEFM